MAQIKESRNSFVVLATQHNPTVVMGNFLIKTGIAHDESDLIKETSIFTPPLAQITFKNGDQLTLDKNRLNIVGQHGNSVFERGIAYIKALPHIMLTAIGINLHYQILGSDFSNYFNNKITTKFEPIGFQFVRKHSDYGSCMISGNRDPNKSDLMNLNLNFDYNFKGKPIKFDEVPFDIIEQKDRNYSQAKEWINELIPNL